MKLEGIYLKSLLKWEMIVDLWDYNKTYKINMEAILKILPVLKYYPSNCPFCSTWHNPQCHGCPLAKKWGHDCREIDSLYDIWFSTVQCFGNTKNLAKQIRNDIKEIYFSRGGESYKTTQELLNRHKEMS